MVGLYVGVICWGYMVGLYVGVICWGYMVWAINENMSWLTLL